MTCPYCKETIQDEALKCRYCGSFINSNVTYEVSADSISADEMRAFIGTNAGYYLRQFSSFRHSGVEKFSPTWNWSCFGFTWLWFLYRKMYLNALITFVIFWVPGVNVILHIVAGVVGNYLYHSHAKEKILEIRRVHPSAQNRDVILQEVGGAHKWVITIGVIITIISLLFFFLFFAAITASFEKFSGTVI